MKLTDADKKYLRSIGYLPRDMRQIEEATSPAVTVYKLDDKKVISLKETIRLLGREGYLASIGRSAFHWSACRETLDDKHFVSFDSSKLFRN